LIERAILISLCLEIIGLHGVSAQQSHRNFLLVEEPGLERRFGEAYRVYTAQVPRWTPRTRPWTGIASL